MEQTLDGVEEDGDEEIDEMVDGLNAHIADNSNQAQLDLDMSFAPEVL